MLKNHLRLAWRNLTKRKGYAALNILGLAIGITCCLLIFHYVAYERSYDAFQQNTGRIVRIRLDNYQQGKLAFKSATSYPAIGPAMKKEFPEVEQYGRLIHAGLLLTNPATNVKFKEEKGYFADASMIGMLDIHLVKGNPANALNGPDKLILSESMAHKYFGNENPLGKRLNGLSDGALKSYEVTGVFKNYPANSHLIIHHLVSYSTLGKILRDEGDKSDATETAWSWYDYFVYLQLKPGASWKALEAKLPAFTDRHINDEWHKKNKVLDELHLIPLSDIHLYSNYNEEAEVNGNGKAVQFLFLIAFLIIAIAWINYTNLATARSLERAKEVGLRKVLGAIRSDLVGQFLIESFLLNTIAALLALGLAILLAPSFNILIGTDAGPFHLPSAYAFGFIAIFLLGSFLSGLYPAFVLSGYHPITVLKGLFKNSTRGQLLRKTLITGQFAISVILITGTILIYQQVQYMRHQSLGANIDRTLVLNGAYSPNDSVYSQIFEPFKLALLQQPGIKNVAASSNVMGQEIYWNNGLGRADKPNTPGITVDCLGIDYDFIPGYDLKLTTGRNFSKQFPTDNKAALINQTAARMLGYKTPEAALNSKVKHNNDTLTVIGVLADYHHLGLQKVITPMLILPQPNRRNYYSIKFNTADIHQTIAAIQTQWQKNFPNDPFDYFFLDESFNAQYKADTHFGAVFGLFATLAILIACFGLLGLSAYNVLQRTKEIGIRKVLGATTQSLVVLLSKDFATLVLLSLIIAVPVTYFVMHSWLQDFAYRIDIQWWVFVLGSLLALLIALATVGIQAARAALGNPVNSLRSE